MTDPNLDGATQYKKLQDMVSESGIISNIERVKVSDSVLHFYFVKLMTYKSMNSEVILNQSSYVHRISSNKLDSISN